MEGKGRVGEEASNLDHHPRVVDNGHHHRETTTQDGDSRSR